MFPLAPTNSVVFMDGFSPVTEQTPTHARPIDGKHRLMLTLPTAVSSCTVQFLHGHPLQPDCSRQELIPVAALGPRPLRNREWGSSGH
ncbi:hypothetical protein CKAH01_11926 [Colletotrichum kahawae]|uniref:Uncharacterized protein n=1 Tax=Colletotrichum kahawae TaxID=34407 RepID=A0AAE0DD96_COLKA|nr:hypothetical protein CKAH01_11926 [Colletotrichum kahawae]